MLLYTVKNKPDERIEDERNSLPQNGDAHFDLSQDFALSVVRCELIARMSLVFDPPLGHHSFVVRLRTLLALEFQMPLVLAVQIAFEDLPVNQRGLPDGVRPILIRCGRRGGGHDRYSDRSCVFGRDLHVKLSGYRDGAPNASQTTTFGLSRRHIRHLILRILLPASTGTTIVAGDSVAIHGAPPT